MSAGASLLSSMAGIRRILLSRMKFIGDIVLTTPVIRAVREKFPGAHIAYLGDKEGVSLLAGNPHLDEIIPYDFGVPAVWEQARTMVRLRRGKFDAVVDLYSNPRSALLAFATGARVRIGKDVPGRGGLYTHRIADDGSPKTAVSFHMQYVKPLGVEPATVTSPEIYLTGAEKREARIFLEWQGGDAEERGAVSEAPLVGLHPGATWPAKMWPWERFADLADLLAGKSKCRVVITRGPGDGGVAERISRRCVSGVSLLPVLPLRQLAGVLSQLDVYVANDNGTMHISAAVGTKTVGIFGPGEEEIWFPYPGPRHAALRRDVPCHPCHLDVCNRTGDGFMECMKLLTVEAVYERVRELLSPARSTAIPRR